MRFMVHWSIDQDKWMGVLELWGSMTPDERMDAGEGVNILGRWHDVAGRTGVAIIETDDLSALSLYLGQWNPHMDIDVTPVLDDEESAAVARAMTASGGG